MKAAALVVGILGSVAAFILSIGTVILGGLGDAFGIEGSGIVLILGWLMLLGSIAALVGALLAQKQPHIRRGDTGDFRHSTTPAHLHWRSRNAFRHSNHTFGDSGDTRLLRRKTRRLRIASRIARAIAPALLE